jgi:hypothetical protein
MTTNTIVSEAAPQNRPVIAITRPKAKAATKVPSFAPYLISEVHCGQRRACKGMAMVQ